MSDSDIELKSALPKKTTKKTPKSPTADLLKKQEDKKVSTKEMIHQALIDLKSRKGTSLYAIKKYIQEKYNIDVEKINHIIKRYLKASVELGTIVQTKGVGASGSFKLASGKDKIVKKKKKKDPKKAEKSEKIEKSDKPKSQKQKSEKSKPKPMKKDETNGKSAKVPKKVEIKESKIINKVKKDNTNKLEMKKEIGAKPKKAKMAKVMQTPAKKRAAMMKRKSIGSIIKPPKMKPKAV